MEISADSMGGWALITGASSGFGAQFARELARRKLNLVLVARRKAELDALARECEAAHGIKTLVVAQDLSKPDAAAAVRAAVDAAQVPVGLLINNAGFGSYGEFETLDLAHELSIIDVNCRAVVALTHAFLPQMVARKKGGLIFLSSIAAYQPTPYFAVYGAAKAFVLSFSDALWAELGPKGITVLALSPGYVDTGFQSASKSGSGPKAFISTPEQVVATALRAFGRSPGVIDGLMNHLRANASRLAPRSITARAAAQNNRPSSLSKR